MKIHLYDNCRAAVAVSENARERLLFMTEGRNNFLKCRIAFISKVISKFFSNINDFCLKHGTPQINWSTKGPVKNALPRFAA